MRLFTEFSSWHPDLPPLVAYEIRNALAHGYLKVDMRIVWKTVEVNLPNLQTQITKTIKDQ